MDKSPNMLGVKNPNPTPLTTQMPPPPQKTETEEEKTMREFMEKLSGVSAKELNFQMDPNKCLVDGKYEIVQLLGSGAYGNVYKVRDIKRKATYALKIMKSHQPNSSSLWREVEILCFLSAVDPQRFNSLMVKMFRPFTFYRHICILYELLGPTVHKILLLNKRKGFPMVQVRHITYQLCIALHYLHQNDVVHLDIKPDNVAFVHSGYDIQAETGLAIMRRTDIRLIDFGSAVFTHQNKLVTATTRVYRAPEMGLRFSWGAPGDIWSMGCTIFETFTGQIFLPCASEVDKCYMIQTIFSEMIPLEMGLTSNLECFDHYGRLKYTAETSQIVKNIKPFDAYNNNPGDADTNMLFHLLKLMLRVVPCRRISALNALQHSFLKQHNSLPQNLVFCIPVFH